MLNVPLGDIASLRFVTTGKYISGWIHRYVVAPGQFPYRRISAIAGFTTAAARCSGRARCQRHQQLQHRALYFFAAALLVQPSDALSITGSFMYQRIDADGYNNYQAPPNNERSISPTISKSRTTIPSICGA